MSVQEFAQTFFLFMKASSSRNRWKSKGKSKRLALFFCLLNNVVFAQKDVVIFHNCENFFYPTNDTLTQDDDYTSEGRKHWTFERYNKKKNSLAKTYIAVGNGELPSLIGLCEVENDNVLNDLCKGTILRKGNYKFIHYDSDDLRGIDVALLYLPSRFTPLEHYKITYRSDKEEERTRDILYVNGVLGNKKINIYVIHAPSRREHNIKKSLRQAIFDTVYRHICHLMSENDETNFLIMGDMNDNPWDSAVKDGFRTIATAKNPQPLLVNIMQNNKNKVGSYVYNGSYQSFDQFIVSRSLLEFTDSSGTGNVFRADFLTDGNPKHRLLTPYSTYKGTYYQGGISDHFPIVMVINDKAGSQKSNP